MYFGTDLDDPTRDQALQLERDNTFVDDTMEEHLNIDLDSVISETEESLQEIREVLKNLNFSTRYKKLDIERRRERQETKENLRDYISALKKEISHLKKLRRSTISLSEDINYGNVFNTYYEYLLESRGKTRKLLKNIFKNKKL